MYDDVKAYYGEVLGSNADLKTNACCTDDSTPAWLRGLMAKVHPEVSAKYYGCGLVAPDLLDGLRILDLGSGSGRDCYVLAGLVGEKGSVVGIDMTPEQLSVARRHQDYHREQFGYSEGNVSFHEGYIERLDELGFDDASFDLIVSNCVINLSPDKPAVLEQAYRLLKPGGELYFSDVYADRRVPDALREDAVLYGECLGGALYWNDFQNMAKAAGFLDPRLVEDRRLTVENEALEAQLGDIRFYSATYRLFKLEGLEPACEDYGQAVIYKGDIPHQPHHFTLDKHHAIETGRVFPVCGNTWRMLRETRFAPHFEFIGEGKTHYGIFEGCGSSIPYDDDAVEAGGTGGGSCC